MTATAMPLFLVAALSASAAHGAPPSQPATCPPMNAYLVTGVSANDMALPDAVALLFASTAWKAEATGAANQLRVSYRNVSGPLDAVFERVIRVAGESSDLPIAAMRDSQRCVIKITVRDLPQPPAALSAITPRVATGAPITPPAPPAINVPVSASPAISPPAISPADRRLARSQPTEPPANDVGLWQARTGETLRYTIEAWAKQEGWKVAWDAGEIDYQISAPLTYRGSMLDAVELILKDHADAAKPLRAVGFLRQKIIQIVKVK